MQGHLAQNELNFTEKAQEQWIFQAVDIFYMIGRIL
jgi:hypothetical protein